MEQTAKIQELINTRASNKLKADLTEFSKSIQNSPLITQPRQIEHPKISIVVEGEPKETTLFYLISHETRGVGHDRFFNGFLLQKLYELHLPLYIERETRDFFDKVERLGDEVEEIRGELENISPKFS